MQGHGERKESSGWEDVWMSLMKLDCDVRNTSTHAHTRHNNRRQVYTKYLAIVSGMFPIDSNVPNYYHQQ